MALTKEMQGAGINRVGSYAISTIDFGSWAQQPVAVAVAPSRRSRTVKEIIHPLWSQCSELTGDPFWKEKFKDMSIGRFPRGFGYQSGRLSYKKATRVQVVEVNDNPYEAATVAIEFFHNVAGIFSPQDEQTSLRNLNRRQEVPLTWGEAGKWMQICMISQYVTTLSESMKLTKEEEKQLQSTIQLGLVCKIISKEHIATSANRIANIEGLLWDPEKRRFYFHPDLKPPAPSRSKAKVTSNPGPKDMTPQFTSRWEKCLEDLEKKLCRYQRRLGRGPDSSGIALEPEPSSPCSQGPALLLITDDA